MRPWETNSPNLTFAFYQRIDMGLDPIFDPGIADPQCGWLDELYGVSTLTAAMIAAYEHCESCLYTYKSNIVTSEYRAFESWLVGFARDNLLERPISPIEDQAIHWHRARHRLNPNTGEVLPPEAQQPYDDTLYLASTSDLTQRLGLTKWQLEYADQQGHLPPKIPGIYPTRWMDVLTWDLPAAKTGIIAAVGTRMPLGANKCALLLSQLWDVHITRVEIERLAKLDYLHPVGRFKTNPVYSPDELEQLDPNILKTSEFAYLEPAEESAGIGSHTKVQVPDNHAPPCPQPRCGGYRVDRPHSWSTQCWGHIDEDEKSSIRSERGPIINGERYLLVDIRSGLEHHCNVCQAKKSNPCQRHGEDTKIPHLNRILAARRKRREIKTTKQKSTSERKPDPMDFKCPHCHAKIGENCLSINGLLVKQPHAKRIAQTRSSNS